MLNWKGKNSKVVHLPNVTGAEFTAAYNDLSRSKVACPVASTMNLITTEDDGPRYDAFIFYEEVPELSVPKEEMELTL